MSTSYPASMNTQYGAAASSSQKPFFARGKVKKTKGHVNGSGFVGGGGRGKLGREIGSPYPHVFVKTSDVAHLTTVTIILPLDKNNHQLQNLLRRFMIEMET